MRSAFLALVYPIMRLAAEAKVTMASRRQGTRVEIRPQRLFSFVLYILPLPPNTITFASHWIVCIYPTYVTAQLLDRVFDKPQADGPPSHSHSLSSIHVPRFRLQFVRHSRHQYIWLSTSAPLSDARDADHHDKYLRL